MLQKFLQKSWQTPNLFTFVLWPLSLLYIGLFKIRGLCYSLGILSKYRAPVPVIVVGNITVGGTGKTPLVIYLVEQLKKLGYKPGVISRGYGGSSTIYPLSVTNETEAKLCGDEPALIVRRTSVPMVVGSNRAEDIKQLIRENDVDIIISDDGLQHLALERDIEICIVDKTTAQLNYYCLPAGPYRESVERLKSVDLIVQHVNEDEQSGKGFEMFLQAQTPVLLQVEKTTNKFDATFDITFDASKGVHAVAGIGKPKRFFNTCRQQGWKIIEHAFADHHDFQKTDIEFTDNLPVLMTEKDAVKCQQFATDRHWYLPVNAKLNKQFLENLQKLIK